MHGAVEQGGGDQRSSARRRARFASGSRGAVRTLVVALVVAVGSVAAWPFPSAAWAVELCGGTPPAGHVRVAVVVDYGTEPGSPGTASVRCLAVPEGTTGGQLLARRAELLGTASPRYGSSGLLCALDGYPGDDECGDPAGAAYRYWSYWSGTTGTWRYGQGNPFVRRVKDGDIEGWRFVSALESQAPPPRVAPDAASLFPAAPAPVAPPAPAAVAPADPPAPSAVAEASPDGLVAPAASTPGPSAGDAEVAATSTTVAVTSTTAAVDAAPPLGELTMAEDGSRDGFPVASVAGAGLVIGLGGLAAWRLRRGTT